MRQGKHRLIHILVTACIGIMIAAWAARLRGFSAATSFQLKLRYASDGCFVSAVLLCGVGVLTLISTTGFFDIFAYGVQTLWHHISSIWRGYEHVRYYDYKAMRAEKRGKGLWYILAVGLCFLAVSVLLLVLYYHL
ncbi:MAG: DUF3899 domain-containing protein [Clostridia bacterium]|nr:DUF3899 domain-containing protein [Clostridia bacterium]